MKTSRTLREMEMHMSLVSELLNRSVQLEKVRLASIAALTDPATIRYLEALGVGEGWRCAEVGAGTGSIARWLCERVGESGRVTAVDINTVYLEELEYVNLDVRCQNIVTEPLEEGSYDLVHVKILIQHLPYQERILQQLVAALRPGGYLLVEESDIRSIQTCEPPSPILTKAAASLATLFDFIGSDPSYGLKLLPAVKRTGLKILGSDCQLSAIQCGSPEIITLTLSLQLLSTQIVSQGIMNREEVKEALELLRQSSDTMIYTPTTVSVWGQRTQD